jgi:hypothetical protein
VRDAGVLERPSTLSASSFGLRFFAAGFFAVPFLVAADAFLLFVGFTEFAGDDRSDDDAREEGPFLRFASVLEVG